MMTDGEHLGEGSGVRKPTAGDVSNPEWVVVKSLLEVNDTCSNTLEEFLLYACTDRVDDLPGDELAEQLDAAIERQRRALTELELAKEALQELDAE